MPSWAAVLGSHPHTPSGSRLRAINQVLLYRKKNTQTFSSAMRNSKYVKNNAISVVRKRRHWVRWLIVERRTKAGDARQDYLMVDASLARCRPRWTIRYCPYGHCWLVGTISVVTIVRGLLEMAVSPPLPITGHRHCDTGSSREEEARAMVVLASGQGEQVKCNYLCR